TSAPPFQMSSRTRRGSRLSLRDTSRREPRRRSAPLYTSSLSVLEIAMSGRRPHVVLDPLFGLLLRLEVILDHFVVVPAMDAEHDGRRAILRIVGRIGRNGAGRRAKFG